MSFVEPEPIANNALPKLRIPSEFSNAAVRLIRKLVLKG